MVKKEGKWPANARVDVDYSKGKPKIKFSYPKNGKSPKEQARSQHRINLIVTIPLFMIFYLAFVIITTSGVIVKDLPNLPEECYTTLDEGFVNMTYAIIAKENGKEVNFTYDINRRFVKGINVSCNTGEYYLKFDKRRTISMKEGFYDLSRQWRSPLLGVAFVLSVAWILGIGFWYSNKWIVNWLVDQRWYQKWFPKAQAEGIIKRWKGKKYIKFKPEDVENNMVEIPSFSNVELDYKTEGDFSKHLDKIKIREHSHYKWKNGKRYKKRTVNIFGWYARFLFKEKPKNGYMEVIYQ